ncbi:MAG TPA: M14 family zinc carboxypeptidase, partial [Chitinophagaceae bacterium]
PCFNPDGWEYNRTSQGGNAGGMWRKNRRLISGSTYGVDLNRNWGVDWANCSAPILGSSTSCGSGSPSSDTYYGPSAFSEAENQAVRTFAQSRNLVTGFDQHAYGPYYSLPFGRQSLHPSDMSVKGENFFTAVPALMGKYNGMRAADSYDALGYEVAGGFKDWMLMGDLGVGNKDTVWAMTGEGGGGSTSSTFWPSASQIVNLCKGMTYQNLQLAYSAGTYAHVEDVDDIAVSALSGNFQFRLKRLGLGNNPITVTLVPIQNINTVGAPMVVNSMNYYDEYTGGISYTLPNLKTGERIQFAWQVDADGYSYSDTITKFYNPTVLLFDNMEGSLATNWDVPNGGGAKWAFTSSSAYSGSQSLTESSSGNYTSGSTRTVTYANSLDLSGATAAYLTFWVKHRAENFRDKLQVQVDGGSGWTPIAGKTTVQEPGTLDGSTLAGQPALTGIQDFWVKEVFDLSAYLGNASLDLRFVFTSNTVSTTFLYDEDDGFYIDDVKVIKTTAPLVILPARFLSFDGQLQADATVKLNWKAE